MTEAVETKRRARTLEEREAALQAELTKLRQQARVKDERKIQALLDERVKINDRIVRDQARRANLDQEIGVINLRLGDGATDD